MKKTLSAFIAFVMAITSVMCISFNAFAEGEPELSFTPANPDDFTMIEEVDGYWNDENEQIFFEYYEPQIFADGNVITLSDGTPEGVEIKYTFDDYKYEFVNEKGESIPANLLKVTCNQAADPWGVGKDNCIYLSLTLDGVTYNGTAFVTIIENPIASIEFVAKDEDVLTVIENYSGCYDEDAGFFRYTDPDLFSIGNKLIIHYKNDFDDTLNCVYDEDNEEYFFVSETTELKISRYQLGLADSQNTKPWTVSARNNYMYISYMNVSQTLKVTVKANPIQSIEYDNTVPITINEGVGGYYDDGLSAFIYDLPSIFIEGKTIKVEYKGSLGSEPVTYVCRRVNGELLFVNENDAQDILNNEYLKVSAEQEKKPWRTDMDNNMCVSYYGVECNATVNVEPSKVQTIEFRPAGTYKYAENFNGYWDTDENGDDYYCYYAPSAYVEGNKITVRELGLTPKTYVCEANNKGILQYVYHATDVFHNDEILSVDDSENNIITVFTRQETNHWNLGKNSFYISLFGKVAEAQAEVSESNVASVEVTTNEPIVLTYCKGGRYTDDDDGDEFYYYDVDVEDYLFAVGTKVKVNYRTVLTFGKTFTYKETGNGFDFVDSKGTSISDGYGCDVLYYKDRQYDEHWKLGKNNFIYVTMFGIITGAIPVTIYCADEDHIPAEAVTENYVKAGCTTAGSYDEVVYCSACGKELSRNHITLDATGHSWGEWQKVSSTMQKRTCGNCGKTEEEEIKPAITREMIREAKAEKIRNSSFKPGRDNILVSWRKSKKADGYQIQYSTNRKFRKKRTKSKFVKKSAKRFRIKHLKRNTKYYVRMRTYRILNGKKVYGKWVKKAVRTKK